MNDKTFILWTTETGGYFKAMFGTREEYDKALETRTLELPTFRDDSRTVDVEHLQFVAFGTIADNFDFVLGTDREHGGVKT